MSASGRLAAALVAAGAILCGAQAAVAEESGSVRLIRTYVQDYVTFDFDGGSITGGTLEGSVTVLQSSGGPFVEGTHERVTCLAYARRSEAGLDLEAPCTMTAPSGDEWYTISRRTSGDVETGGGGPGTLDILGGTGAYAGLSGTCTYEVEYLPDDWVSMIADCTWQR